MRLGRALFLGTVFAVSCCTCSTLALPNIFRRQASDGLSDASTRSEVELLNLDPVDQAAIFGDANLAYLEEPKGQACYAHIYDHVKAGCVRNSNMNSDERMFASVLLTLCDIQASNQSVPWECDSVQEQSDQGSLGPCIEALSRSTRYWSSYAGYLREVPRMCFALQRWKDMDRARELYKTATEEKIALIRFWHQKAQEVVTRSDAERLDRQDWLKQLLRLKEQMQDDLQEQRLALQVLITEQTEKGNSLVDSLQNLEPFFKHSTERLLKQYEDALREYSNDLSRQVASRLKQVIDDHSTHIDRSVQQHFSKATDLVEAKLAAPLQTLHQTALILESHTLALGLALQQQDGLVSDLTLLSSEMLSVQREHHEQLETELDALRRIHTGFEAINRGLNASQASLDVLLSTHRSSASLPMLSSVGFAVEGMVLWSLRQLEGRTGLGVGNIVARRCFRWLILLWPETLKLKASIMVSIAIFKALAATIVLLAMLLKSFFQPLSLYIIRPLCRSGNTSSGYDSADSDARKNRSDLMPDYTVVTTGQGLPDLGGSWCVLTSESARARIPSRCGIPHETRLGLASSDSLSMRRSRIHCPSAH